MGAPGEKTRASADVVATRKKMLGGLELEISTLISTLTVRADGTLHLDRTASKGETRTVPRERVRPLIDALSKPEWQEVESSYGVEVPRALTIVVQGGGKSTTVATLVPELELESPPPILEEVLSLLENLWPVEEDVVEPPVST
jgi:hypothetical protein